MGSTALKVIRKDRTVFLAVTKVDKITGPPKALWEDPLEEGLATQSSILAWKIPVDRGAWRATVHGVTKSGTRLSY